MFVGKLRNHFEERFRYNEEGVPRVWKPDDDIDGAFKKAKDQVSLQFLNAVLSIIGIVLIFFHSKDLGARTLVCSDSPFR